MQQNNQLNETELYNESLCFDKIGRYVEKYSDIVVEFIEFIYNQQYKTNTNYQMYVLLKGLQSLQHIFSFILLYTCNLQLATYNVQKAFYYYVEFVEQIQKEEQFYVKFNLNDAILFIYKKTIYEINPDYIKTIQISEETILTLKQINNILDDINDFLIQMIEYIVHNFNKNISIKDISKDIKLIILANISNLEHTTHTDTLIEIYKESIEKTKNIHEILKYYKSYYNI